MMCNQAAFTMIKALSLTACAFLDVGVMQAHVQAVTINTRVAGWCATQGCRGCHSLCQSDKAVRATMASTSIPDKVIDRMGTLHGWKAVINQCFMQLRIGNLLQSA